MEKTTANANLFEIATRMKLRFPWQGKITPEDLWDLSVTQLDAVYKTLNAERKRASEDSLLATKSAEDAILDVKIDIVKYIVAKKQDEADKRKAVAAVNAQKRQLEDMIAAKKIEELGSKSVDELQAMLDKLNEQG